MSKELEALEILEYLDQISKEEIVVRNGNTVYTNSREKPPFTRLTTVGTYFKGIDDVKQAIQRLNAIDNSNLKESLNDLEMLSNCAEAMKEAPSSNWIEYAQTEAELDLKLYLAYSNIQQALLKAQEQEKENAKYKQFEKEIGIPLEIAFRALKEGIYIEKGQFPYTSLEKHNVRGIELYGLGVISNICSYGDCDFTCLYKDYKKCWWLKADKSE